MQIELFNDNEIMSKKEIKRKEAKEYTANRIYRSSGERDRIKKPLQKNDFNNAFKAFDHAFKTFGFADGNYRFLSPISSKGTISNNEVEFEVTSKELFQVLLDISGY